MGKRVVSETENNSTKVSWQNWDFYGQSICLKEKAQFNIGKKQFMRLSEEFR